MLPLLTQQQPRSNLLDAPSAEALASRPMRRRSVGLDTSPSTSHRGRLTLRSRSGTTRGSAGPDCRILAMRKYPGWPALRTDLQAPALPVPEESGRAGTTPASGVMQPSAIGAGDDCCDRGRSRSSRALWRRAARQAAPGAHDGSPTGCDGRAHGVAVTAGGPEFGPPYDGRLLTDDRGLAASRLPDGRNGRSVAATLAAPVHRRSSASPRSYVNGIDARTLRRRRRRPRRPPPSSRTDR